MNELRLLFTSTADNAYSIHLENHDGNPTAPQTFTPFLDDKDFENLRWYLEEFMDLPDGGAVTRAGTIEAQLNAWGRKLYDAVFTASENEVRLKQLLASKEPPILTIGTDDARLLRLPWELIADNAGPLCHRVSVRRQLATPENAIARTVVLPLRILYIISRPADTGFIDPRLTTQSLFDALDPLGSSVCIDFCRPPTLARMEELLRQAEQAGDPYDIVHFDGHGTFIPEIQLGGLCFESAEDTSSEGKTDLVRADRLGTLLAKYKIPLVVLGLPKHDDGRDAAASRQRWASWRRHSHRRDVSTKRSPCLNAG